MVDKAGLVTVIILNYNGMQHSYLPDCLSSLVNQTYRQIEIVVVDNASSDDSLSLIEVGFSDVILVKNEENLGFCRGNNLGLMAASGEIVLFANNDTVFQPDCVEKLVIAMQSNPQIGVVSAKLIRPSSPTSPPLLDSAGLLLRQDLTLRDRGFAEQDMGQFDQPAYLFSACGAAMCLRRDAIESVLHEDGTLWDETFFAYYEDGDLGWRLRNQGWVCYYEPAAVIVHHRGGSSPPTFFNKPPRFQMHTVKNRYLMIIKNASWPLILKQLSRLLVKECLIWGYILLHPRLAWATVRELIKTVPIARRRRVLAIGEKPTQMPPLFQPTAVTNNKATSHETN